MSQTTFDVYTPAPLNPLFAFPPPRSSLTSSTHFTATFAKSADVTAHAPYKTKTTFLSYVAAGTTACSPIASQTVAVAAPMTYPTTTCGLVWYPSFTLSQVKNTPSAMSETQPGMTKVAETGHG